MQFSRGAAILIHLSRIVLQLSILPLVTTIFDMSLVSTILLKIAYCVQVGTLDTGMLSY